MCSLPLTPDGATVAWAHGGKFAFRAVTWVPKAGPLQQQKSQDTRSAPRSSCKGVARRSVGATMPCWL